MGKENQQPPEAAVASRTRRARVVKLIRTSARKMKDVTRGNPKTDMRLRPHSWRAELRPCPWPDRTRALDGIASAVVELLPSGSADRNIAHQTDRAINGEAFGDIDDVAVRAIIFEIGTLIRRARDIWQGNDRFSAVATSATTDPLVAAAVEVEAVGSEAIAEDANRSSSVIVATIKPLGSVTIAVVTV
jgi:hypothetical protein